MSLVPLELLLGSVDKQLIEVKAKSNLYRARPYQKQRVVLAVFYRRRLNMKAKFEKRFITGKFHALKPGKFNTVSNPVDLQRPTMFASLRHEGVGEEAPLSLERRPLAFLVPEQAEIETQR
jgi:hypothetical protein